MTNPSDFFEKQTWTFAKSYADKAPHEYIVRSEINGSDDEFVNAVEYIRANGIKMNFWRKENVYLFIGNKYYWTMGAPIEETIIINRADVNDYTINVYPKARVQNDIQGE